METLASFIPQDRLRALARGEALPDHVEGSALLAGISGLTLLAESLTGQIGPRHGADQVAHLLNRVYAALITEVETHGGSVLSFAGDAMLCWFGSPSLAAFSGPAPRRAVACAWAMHRAMQAFARVVLPLGEMVSLAVKVGVATGPARRLVVGDSAIRCLDVLAGPASGRVTVAAHLAHAGEVLVDQVTLAQLDGAAEVHDWRAAETGERFAVLDASGPSLGNEDRAAAAPLDPGLAAEELRCWLLPAVYDRFQGGADELFADLRPVVAMAIQFSGLEGDAGNDAGRQLDAYVRWVQRVLAGHGGVLLDVVTAAQGGHLYAAFGALATHEDDARRAAIAALELRLPPAELGLIYSTQIGLSQGMMRVGAYGGPTRRTFGALGDNAHVARRLMEVAAPGQVIVGDRVRQAAGSQFAFEAIPAVDVQGKTQPVTAFSLAGPVRHKSYRLFNPSYTSPMVGRKAELELISSKMDLALQGFCQIVAVTGEAGAGKSRLVAEAIHLAQRRRFSGYGGGCSSDGAHTPYQVWQPILRGLFDLNADAPLEKQAERLAAAVESLAAQRLSSLPLIAGAMGLSLPDNGFTHGLAPEDRKLALEASIVDCVRGAAQTYHLVAQGLLLVLEDLHWMDVLSQDLLEAIGRGVANLPVLFLLTYRPLDLVRPAIPRLDVLSYLTEIELAGLSPAEGAQLIRTQVARLYPGRRGDLPPGATDRLMAQAQGNPFYLEELLNYLRDQDLDPYNPAGLDSRELPDSLRTLILSRLDRLAEREKTVLKVASIIGQAFRVDWLHGYYPALGDPAGIQADLDRLHRLGVTPWPTTGSGPAYLFKHVISHQVTYESMPHATRALLHGQLARYLEETYPHLPLLDTLAHHYGHSDNLPKQAEFFRRAGDAACEAFHNDAALDYYARLLPLLAEPAERIDLDLQWGSVLELIGQWDQAEAHYWRALKSAQEQNAAVLTARCLLALGKLAYQRADYPAAFEWLEPARAAWAALGDQAGLSQTLVALGLVHWRAGEYALARQPMEEGLALARLWDDKQGTAAALVSLGIVNSVQGDLAGAEGLYQEGLALYRALGDKRGIAAALNNLGNVSNRRDDYQAARAFHEESLALWRQIGRKWGIATSLSNLGNLARSQDDLVAARAFCEESLALDREIGDRWGIALSLHNLGGVALCEGDCAAAQALYEEGLALCREMGDKRNTAVALQGLGLVALAQEDVVTARQLIAESLWLRREIDYRRGMASSLIGLAGVALDSGDPLRAARLVGAADGLLSYFQVTTEPELRGLYARTTASARVSLGEQAFDAARAQGGNMPLEQAVADALREQ